MKKVVLATKNRGKVAELQTLLRDLDIEVLSMEQAGNIPEIVEDGATFFENAMKKARIVAENTGLVSIADDSGLEVDILGGRPGIFSARFSGPDATDEDNNLKLLQELMGVSRDKRTARFRCAVVAWSPDGSYISAQGVCEGRIAFAPRGTQGFGYDPVFLPEGEDRTMAELTPEEKNKISHRGKALRELKRHLAGFLAARDRPKEQR